MQRNKILETCRKRPKERNPEIQKSENNTAVVDSTADTKLSTRLSTKRMLLNIVLLTIHLFSRPQRSERIDFTLWVNDITTNAWKTDNLVGGSCLLLISTPSCRERSKRKI